jgi:hypothetical protein
MVECVPHGVFPSPQPIGLTKKRYDDSDSDIKPCHEMHAHRYHENVKTHIFFR